MIYLYSFLAIFVVQLLFFFYAYVFQSDKLTDFAYATTFMAVSIYFFLLSSQSALHIILLICVLFWGGRLAKYLFMRIQTMGHDSRFNEMRKSFVKFGSFWLLQAITIWVLLLPVITVMSLDLTNFSWPSVIGVVIFFFGLVIETIADYQKFLFKVDHPKQFTNTGLWSKARHPNYFGEICVWLGIFIICLPVFSGWQHLTIISPLFITCLLLFVSGIPLLEKQWTKRYGELASFQEWKKTTNMLRPF